MKYTIYKVTNKINGKIYIGKHQTENPYDNYLGSGKAIKNAIKKYGKDSFKKDVLFIFDSEEEMNIKEREIVNESFISTDKTYNSGIGGEGGAMFLGRKHTKETRRKLSEKATGRVLTEETRRKISESNRRRVVIEETRRKLSEKATGRVLSEETRRKISEKAKERKIKTLGMVEQFLPSSATI